MLTRTILSFIAGLLLSFPSHAQQAGSHGEPVRARQVEHAEIVMPATASLDSLGLLSIWNGEDAPFDLVAVESDGFGRVRLHRTVSDGQVQRSLKVRGALTIPPRSELVMRPDGIHLVMSDPTQRLVEGSSVSLTLRFSEGADLQVLARIQLPGTPLVDHHHAGVDGTADYPSAR